MSKAAAKTDEFDARHELRMAARWDGGPAGRRSDIVAGGAADVLDVELSDLVSDAMAAVLAGQGEAAASSRGAGEVGDDAGPLAPVRREIAHEVDPLEATGASVGQVLTDAAEPAAGEAITPPSTASSPAAERPSVGALAPPRAAEHARPFTLDQAIESIATKRAMLESGLGRLLAPAPASEAATPTTGNANGTGTLAAATLAMHRATPVDEAPAPTEGLGAPAAPPLPAPPSEIETDLGVIQTPEIPMPAAGRTAAKTPTKSERSLRDIAPRKKPRPLDDRLRDDIQSIADRVTSLDHQVAILTTRVEHSIETQIRPEAIDRLEQQIERSYASLAARLSADRPVPSQENAPTPEAGAPVEPIDLQALDAMVRRLAVDVTEVMANRVDTQAVIALQQQMADLVARIDRSDGGLSTLASIDGSMSALLSHMEETRDAVIGAAEKAARAAARAMLDPSPTRLLAADQPDQAEPAFDGLRRDILELRESRDADNERLQEYLGALIFALEKVVRRLGVLEGETDEDPGLREPPFTWAIPSRTGDGRITLSTRRRIAPDMVAFDDPDSISRPEDNQTEDLATRRDVVAEADPIQAAPVIARDPIPVVQANPVVQAKLQATESSDTRGAGVPGDLSLAVGEPGRPATAARDPFRPSRVVLAGVAGLAVVTGAVGAARFSPAHTRDVTMLQAHDRGHPGSDREGTPSNAAGVSSKADEGPGKPAEPSGPSGVATAAPPAVAPPQVTTLAALDPVQTSAAQSATRQPTSAGIGAGLHEMAMQGNASAQFEVALRMAEGRGVARDPKGAAAWFQKAADQGLAPAAYRLGSLYERGAGVPRDPGLAIAWYEKAAAGGNVRAMHNLAVMSAAGANGKTDYPKAASWFTKAAEAGVRDSQFNLAILYARGLGVSQDLGQSFFWFTIAGQQGDLDAGKQRDALEQRLDAASLAQARKKAGAFQPVPAISAANEVAAPPGGWDAVAPSEAQGGLGSKGSTKAGDVL